ncbi:MAG TPA: hypothetical protein VEC99_03375, partial [Clostridia bacterium]|nr:hypothetical protein [Clostridia bacterium]
MNKLLPGLVACFGVVISVYGQTDPMSLDAASTATKRGGAEANYSVVERGPHHRVWARVSWEPNPLGGFTARTNTYTELCGGLHYQDQGGQWVEAREQIEAFPGGAVARQGQTQVIFANNLATAGAIDMQAPDGQRFRSHILGLSYYSPRTGQNVLIAEVKDCQGQIVEPNQVVYPDAFTDIAASVRYTYTRAGFEQDVIIESQLPEPEEFGLDSEDCVLQVLTEFITPNEPVATPREVRFESGVQAQDQDLDFGAVQMGRGRAFSLEPASGRQDIPVFKQWGTIEGRRIL